MTSVLIIYLSREEVNIIASVMKKIFLINNVCILILHSFLKLLLT